MTVIVHAEGWTIKDTPLSLHHCVDKDFKKVEVKAPASFELNISKLQSPVVFSGD